VQPDKWFVAAGESSVQQKDTDRASSNPCLSVDPRLSLLRQIAVGMPAVYN
jgi:hypothetical protein